jgi:aspartyl-tRNA(Asn)/glutamyl-tRNA(Gln) amidotransferase subunit A
MRMRQLLRQSVNRALETCHALLLPTLPMAAPTLGAATVDIGGQREPVRAAMLRLTQLFNVTGHPALALPAGLGVDRMPRSLQVICGTTVEVIEAALTVERCLAE